MAKKNAEVVTLECTECKNRNYQTPKLMKGEARTKRLEFKKYCPKCDKHTMHKQTK